MYWTHTKNQLPEPYKPVLLWYNEEPQKVYRDGDKWFWLYEDKTRLIKGDYWMEIIPPNE